VSARLFEGRVVHVSWRWRLRGLWVGALVSVVAGLLVVSPLFGSPRLLPRAATITISDRLVKHTRVDGGMPGGGAGDIDFYRQLLFNTRVTPKPIGHSDVTCTHTGTGSLNCSGTYFLPRGKLVVGGVIGSRLLYNLAVLGGTGLYNNVRGTLTGTSISKRPARELLVFRLQT
jgi:hypothetical protein